MGDLLGPNTSYDCYCPYCNKYVGSWWHYDYVNEPIFFDVPCTENPAGYPYCKTCGKISWSKLKKNARKK